MGGFPSPRVLRRDPLPQGERVSPEPASRLGPPYKPRVHRMLRKLLIAAVLVLACGVLAVEFYPVHVLIWDGGYKLTVHIDTPAGPPSAVGCYAVGRREHAEEH